MDIEELQDRKSEGKRDHENQRSNELNDDLGLVIFFEKVTHDDKTEISVVLFFGITIAV